MEAKLQELNKYREALVKKLEDLQKKRQEMIDAKDMTKMSQVAKYRQFGDELLNTDPEMAKKYYAQADALEKSNNTTKGDKRELEQLWKDADRSRRQAQANGDTAGVEMYTNLQDKLKAQLEVIAPETWGDSSTKTGGGEEKKTAKTDVSALETEIKPLLVDKTGNNGKPDGVLDNLSDINDKISKWARKYDIPVNDPEIKRLLTLVSNRDAELGRIHEAVLKEQGINFSQSETIKNRQRAEGITAMKNDADWKWLYNPMKRLLANPTDKGAKMDVLKSALREESGAAISASEAVEFLQQNLKGDMLEQYTNEMNGLGMSALNYISSDIHDKKAKKMALKYVDSIDPSQLVQKIQDKIPDAYLEFKEEQESTSKGGKPKRGDYASGSEWITAVNEWKAK